MEDLKVPQHSENAFQLTQILLICFTLGRMNVIIRTSLKLSKAVSVFLKSTKRFFKEIWRKIYPDEVSAMLDEYATALAFGHFFYCKNFLFPDLKKKKEEFEDKINQVFATDKVLFLIPQSCEFHIDDSLYPDNYLTLRPVIKSVAGTYHRKYDVAVLKTSFSQEEYFIVDCPSCLLSIPKIKDVSEDISDRLTEEVMNQIRNSFVQILDYLLDEEPGCSSRYQFLYYEGKNPEINALQENWFSSGELSARVVQQPTIRFRYLGISLAYQFYSNYLQRLFPGLSSRMKKWEQENKVRLAILQLVILIPDSCSVAKTLDDSSHNDNNIERSGKFDLVQKVTTNIERTYTTTIYKITAKSSLQRNLPEYNKQEVPVSYRVCVEYATPIKQIYNTRNEFGDLFSKSQMIEERKSFAKNLRFLLKEDKEYGHLCDIIEYNDHKGIRKVSEVLENYLLKNRNLSHSSFAV